MSLLAPKYPISRDEVFYENAHFDHGFLHHEWSVAENNRYKHRL